MGGIDNMSKSATALGQEYGLTAREMNFVLREEGFLGGEPGNYTVTEKGEKFAEEQDYHRGTDGYAYYNRYWTTRTWDNGITEKLDITEDRKKEIRQAIASAKQKISKSEEEDITINCDSYGNETADRADDDYDALVAAVAVLLIAASSYGIYKATPYIKQWWNNKAIPGLMKVKNKFTDQAEKTKNGTDNNRKSSDLKED